MQPHPHRPTPGDLASEVGGLSTGLGILTMTFFPLALPGLLLALLLVLPLLPLVLLAGLVYLVRRAWQGRSRRAARARALREEGEARSPARAGRALPSDPGSLA
jgi:threonine/homoserine/homoserine lactone efflux protein